jgi:hypothetical protein
LITLQDGSVQPTDVDVHAQAPLHLVLSNKSGEPCLFYFGNYLRGLPVPQHGFADVSFTPGPAASRAVSGSGGGTPAPAGIGMGCLGDAQRQGRINVS